VTVMLLRTLGRALSVVLFCCSIAWGQESGLFVVDVAGTCTGPKEVGTVRIRWRSLALQVQKNPIDHGLDLVGPQEVSSFRRHVFSEVLDGKAVIASVVFVGIAVVIAGPVCQRSSTE